MFVTEPTTLHGRQQTKMTILPRPEVTYILADLDDTLYENLTMQHQVAENIRHYMVEKLDIPADEVAEKCADLYLNYGTTLAGLVANGYKIDYDDWHASVHGSLDYEQYLKPDPALRAMLDSIPLPKAIFTNADRAHAARCLDLLGITECFERVISFEEVMEAAEQAGMVHHGCPVVCKPNRQAFDVALKLVGGPQPSSTLWLDDSARNITTGHKLGMYSVLVGRRGVMCPSDLQMRDIHDMPAAMPWLWQGQQPPAAPAAASAPAAPHKPSGALETAAAAQNGVLTQAVKAAAAAAGKGSPAAATSSEGEIEAVYVAAA